LEEVCEIDPWGQECSLLGRVKIVKKAYEPSVEEVVQFEQADTQEREKAKYTQIRGWMDGNEAECEMTDTFKDATIVSEPTFEEYIGFLSTGVFDREKERYIRLHAWWSGNDPRRQSGGASPMTQAEKTNLRAFLPFLDEASDGDRLMKAEGFRELGTFAAAEKLLATHFDPNLKKAADFIRDLSRRGVTSVEGIPS
jgi:hypothetical protein